MRQIYRIIVAEEDDGTRFNSPKLSTEDNIRSYLLACALGRAKVLYSVKVILPDRSGSERPVTSGLERLPCLR